jgi:hypothetical protein
MYATSSVAAFGSDATGPLNSGPPLHAGWRWQDAHSASSWRPLVPDQLGPCARKEVRRDLLAEAKKRKAWKLLRLIPGIGPIRAALVTALMQAPFSFLTGFEEPINPSGPLR